MSDIRILGVSRVQLADGGSDKALLVHFADTLTDDAVRAFHDLLGADATPTLQRAETMELGALRRFFELWHSLHQMARGGSGERAAQKTTLEHYAMRVSDSAADVIVAQRVTKDVIQDLEKSQRREGANDARVEPFPHSPPPDDNAGASTEGPESQGT